MRTIGRHTGTTIVYIGRHRGLFINYLANDTYAPRHGAGVWDVAA